MDAEKLQGAKCSLCELETQMFLANDLGYLEGGEIEKIQQELANIERMPRAL